MLHWISSLNSLKTRSTILLTAGLEVMVTLHFPCTGTPSVSHSTVWQTNECMCFLFWGFLLPQDLADQCFFITHIGTMTSHPFSGMSSQKFILMETQCDHTLITCNGPIFLAVVVVVVVSRLLHISLVAFSWKTKYGMISWFSFLPL